MSTIFSDDTSKEGKKMPYTKDSPFFAKIKERYLLNKKGSSKKTFHVSLDISGSGIEYEEGDSLAVIPSNCPSMVEEFLQLCAFNENESIFIPRKEEKTSMNLKEYLLTKANLSKISPGFFNIIKDSSKCVLFKNLLETDLEDPDRKKAFIESHDLLSLLKSSSGIECSAQRVVDHLSPLLPRFYSIASSSKANKESVDLLVATFSYEVRGEIRYGIGSDFLCNRADHTTIIPIYHQPNPNFKLPQSSTTPIIMIGPGTGLAPFRGFLQKRLLDSTATKNWLFFGERHKNCDFYYENELLDYQSKGLVKLSLAFSRDGEKKTYVQDLIAEQKDLIWDWIKEGAIIYLCGDAKSMAKDVTETFLNLFMQKGGFSLEEARGFLQLLRKEKRYQADVY